MATLGKIEAVLFDLDETLLHQSRSFDALLLDCAQEFEADLGPATPKQFLSAFWPHSADMWHMMVDGVLPGNTARRYAFRNTLRELGANLDIDAALCKLADTRIVDAGALFEDVLEVLAQLRAAGKPIGIVTNGYTDVQRRKIERHGLGAYVDFILVSEEAGAHKPAPAIFEQAIDKAGTSPEASLFVGDLLQTDILGADTAGLKTVHIDPKGRGDAQRAERADLPIPNHTITTLTELLPLLGLHP